MPDWKKLIEGKIALATRGAKPGKANENARIPAGQTEVKNFPTLDLGIRPDVTTENWSLRIYGLVEKELNINWAQFQAMAQVTEVSDFHCVTRWSQLDMDWQGVPAREIIAMAEPLQTAKYVTLHGYDGYTTNLPLDALLDDDVIVAHSVLGAPLTPAHGGPVRIIVPKRYAWKGAKWLKAIELHEFDRPGFWEVRGYHNEADPWKEERFSDD
ncbi:MAG: molybdopterin-dependent oxidoreductase [Methylotenera sp.]|nr:molybdopterin-dependent oxidoreductase [Methylotenera sp.]